MNHKLGHILLFFLLVSLSASIPRAGAQQRELPLEKILNPLPDFDPFEKPLAPPQYFPDEVDKRTRDALIDHLKEKGILAVFHYQPLHLSRMGRSFGYKAGDCPVTEDLSQRLVRLPLYNDMNEREQDQVIESVRAFRPSDEAS